MKKKKLEMILQSIPPISYPKSDLEQYMTPSHIAADMLYFAHSLGDIEGKKVMDLGCGSGIFAIGAKLLGASKVIGIDIDEEAIEAAREHAQSMEVDIDLQKMDIRDFNETGDTVLQNPPFGSQKVHADRPFLEKALALSNVTYSLHLFTTSDFIKLISNKLKSEITHTKQYNLEVKHTFDFHTKEKRWFVVTLFRLKNNRGMK